MPQNTDNNNNTDETGTLGLVTGSNSVQIEPPDPPDQNDTRIVEIGQHGSVMDPEAQAFDGDIIATTSNATDNNDDAHWKERQNKRKATDIREDKVDTEIRALKEDVHDEEVQIKDVRGRLETDENMMQKMIDEIKILKSEMNNLAKENTEVMKENCRLAEKLSHAEERIAKMESMIDFLTLKANETDRKFKQFEHTKQDRQSWAQVASLAKKSIP